MTEILLLVIFYDNLYGINLAILCRFYYIELILLCILTTKILHGK